jgi:glycosyltransferase involved in cell wall biosynthesis
MQVGCPSIISHQSGCAEILKHAIKTDYWDIDAMADAIYAIVKYPAMYKSLHELGKAEVNTIRWYDAGLKVRGIYDGVINHTL